MTSDIRRGIFIGGENKRTFNLVSQQRSGKPGGESKVNCEDCVHFRPRRRLSEGLKPETSEQARLYVASSDLEDEFEVRDAERMVACSNSSDGMMDAPPLVADYCAYNNGAFIHWLKNSDDKPCGDWKERITRSSCQNCVHRLESSPPLSSEDTESEEEKTIKFRIKGKRKELDEIKIKSTEHSNNFLKDLQDRPPEQLGGGYSNPYAEKLSEINKKIGELQTQLDSAEMRRKKAFNDRKREDTEEQKSLLAHEKSQAIKNRGIMKSVPDFHDYCKQFGSDYYLNFAFGNSYCPHFREDPEVAEARLKRKKRAEAMSAVLRERFIEDPPKDLEFHQITDINLDLSLTQTFDGQGVLFNRIAWLHDRTAVVVTEGKRISVMIAGDRTYTMSNGESGSRFHGAVINHRKQVVFWRIVDLNYLEIHCWDLTTGSCSRVSTLGRMHELILGVTLWDYTTLNIALRLELGGNKYKLVIIDFFGDIIAEHMLF